MIDKINVDCQGLTTQVETALKQNADLLKTLKETPSVETITNQVKETLDKEYEFKFKNLEDQLVREKTSPGGITQGQLKKAGQPLQWPTKTRPFKNEGRLRNKN